MKIIIYGICKNESRFAKRFMKSMDKVDNVIICDTGSTDGTQDILRKHGAKVYDVQISPFRFDLARNMALMHIPEDTDIAISMDIDEVLVEGWRDIVEKAWVNNTTILRYPFIHNWEDEKQTIPRLSVWGFKVHCPKSYMWKYPMHETLELKNDAINESVAIIDKEIIKHYPDPKKEERFGRIDLLETGAKENPSDQRMAHLYGRELYFHKRYNEAIKEFKRHLEITHAYNENDIYGISQTRSTTCRLIAKSLMAMRANPDEIITWLLRAVSEFPYQREPWIILAQAWFTVGDYASAYACVERGLAITNRLTSIELEEWCWDEQVYKLRDDVLKLITK